MSRPRHTENSAHILANATYWFEHELRQYPSVDLDLAALKAHAERIVRVVGRESRGYPCYEVSVELGKAIGRGFIELPAGHVGYLTQPVEFARELMQAICATMNRSISEGATGSRWRRSPLDSISITAASSARGTTVVDETASLPVFAQASQGASADPRLS